MNDRRRPDPGRVIFALFVGLLCIAGSVLLLAVLGWNVGSELGGCNIGSVTSEALGCIHGVRWGAFVGLVAGTVVAVPVVRSLTMSGPDAQPRFNA